MRNKIIVFVLGIFLIGNLAACGGEANSTKWQEQYDLGVRLLSEGNYEEAIIAFKAAIEIDPKQADAYLGLADTYIAMGDVDSALQALRDGYAAAGDMRLQARIDELSSPESSSASSSESAPESTTGQTDELPEESRSQSGESASITFNGEDRNMSMSLTCPGLPDEVLVNVGEYNMGASFGISFSDGHQTFSVFVNAFDNDNDNEHMVAFPNSDACLSWLSATVYKTERSEGEAPWYWNGFLSIPVTRNDDTLTWNFTLPDAGFSISDICYIGYTYYYTQNSETTQSSGQATFEVENGELTYLNNRSVDDLGFFISEDDFYALYR